MKNTVRWGVLGCAGIAEGRFLPGFLKAPNAELHAISSRGNSDKLKRFQEKFHPAVSYESYEALLEDPAVDAVYIPLPNGLHCEWVIKAAEKKKHILCEKPMGISKAQVKQMQEACDRNGVILMEAFAYRQSPLTKKAKEIVDSGILGKIQYAESQYGYLLENRGDVRLSKKLSGGATYDIGCYNLNLLRYLLGGEPTRIRAMGRIGEQSGVDEESSILMEFADGVRAFSYCSLGVFPFCFYKVVGDQGILEVSDEFNCRGEAAVTVKTQAGVRKTEIDCPDNYMLEAEHFSRVILEGEKRLITPQDSLGNAAVIEESLRQIAGGRDAGIFTRT